MGCFIFVFMLNGGVVGFLFCCCCSCSYYSIKISFFVRVIKYMHTNSSLLEESKNNKFSTHNFSSLCCFNTNCWGGLQNVAKLLFFFFFTTTYTLLVLYFIYSCIICRCNVLKLYH